MNMSRKMMVPVVLFALACVQCGMAVGVPPPPVMSSSKPNIIFFLTDDQVFCSGLGSFFINPTIHVLFFCNSLLLFIQGIYIF